MVTEKLIVVRLKGVLGSYSRYSCNFAPPPPLSPLAAEESNAERCIIVFQNIPPLCHPSLRLFVLLNAVKNLFGLWSGSSRRPPPAAEARNLGVAVIPPSLDREKTVERLSEPPPSPGEGSPLRSVAVRWLRLSVVAAAKTRKKQSLLPLPSLIPARSERGNRMHGGYCPQGIQGCWRSPSSTRIRSTPRKAHCSRRNRMSPHRSGRRKCRRGNPKRGRSRYTCQEFIAAGNVRSPGPPRSLIRPP